jgi:polyisoprenoid-binding protein YceI
MVGASSGGRRWRWLVVGVVTVAVLAVAGPFAYINFIKSDAPAPLTAATTTPSSPATTRAGQSTGDDPIAGSYSVTSGSQAGYRVKEVLFGQDTEAVGRTSAVSGQITVDGTRVTAGDFSVDLTTVQSDQSRRDNQFHTRIMDTATYPTATFKLAQPIELASLPADGATITAKALGQLTLHGTTRQVTVDVSAQRSASSIRLSGQIPVSFADWNIPNPSFGPASTEDHGLIEFLLVLARA